MFKYLKTNKHNWSKRMVTFHTWTLYWLESSRKYLKLVNRFIMEASLSGLRTVRTPIKESIKMEGIYVKKRNRLFASWLWQKIIRFRQVTRDKNSENRTYFFCIKKLPANGLRALVCCESKFFNERFVLISWWIYTNYIHTELRSRPDRLSSKLC